MSEREHRREMIVQLITAIELHELKTEHYRHEFERAVDNCIAKSIKRPNAPAKAKVEAISQAEYDYRQEIASNLEAALSLGSDYLVEMPNCRRLVASITSILKNKPAADALLFEAKIELQRLGDLISRNITRPTNQWELHCETMEADGARHRDIAKSWKAAHPEDKRTIDELKKASENYRAERNRKRKAAENPR